MVWAEVGSAGSGGSGPAWTRWAHPADPGTGVPVLISIPAHSEPSFSEAARCHVRILRTVRKITDSMDPITRGSYGQETGRLGGLWLRNEAGPPTSPPHKRPDFHICPDACTYFPKNTFPSKIVYVHYSRS